MGPNSMEDKRGHIEGNWIANDMLVPQTDQHDACFRISMPHTLALIAPKYVYSCRQRLEYLPLLVPW